MASNPDQFTGAVLIARDQRSGYLPDIPPLQTPDPDDWVEVDCDQDKSA
jgi:hypothetical protein